ncbi:MAG: hypothetical protein AAF618_09890 [Pseudomonadota bacterium]
MAFGLILGLLSIGALLDAFSASDEDDSDTDEGIEEEAVANGPGAGAPGNPFPVDIPDDDVPDDDAAGSDLPEEGPADVPVDLSDSGSVIVGPDDGFAIELVFEGEWSEAARDTVIEAAQDVAALITEDVPDALSGPNKVDDIRIVAELADDLPDNVLGFGGFTSIRPDSWLPVDGLIQIKGDEDPESDLFYQTAVHEMLHALGFGLNWEPLGLVSDASGELRFTGEAATSVYEGMVARGEIVDEDAALGVPMSEGDEAHWSEDVFGGEIMTPILNGDAELSELTVAALDDMGYETDFKASSSLLAAFLDSTTEEEEEDEDEAPSVLAQKEHAFA